MALNITVGICTVVVIAAVIWVGKLENRPDKKDQKDKENK